MKTYRFVKQEGETREVLGEIATELDVHGQVLLMLKGAAVNEESLETFKREWERLQYESMLILAIADNVKVEYMRLEEVAE